MSATLNRFVAERYEEIRCCSCSVVFFVPEQFRRDRLSDTKTFHCPNGHPQCFARESAADKAVRLERELANAKASQRFAEQLLANERVQNKKNFERVKKRQMAGTCPCCHRTFSQVARHMKSKHPELGK